MAGSTLSFVADPTLVARIKEIAKSDGVSQSQAAARASAFGAMLSPAARKTLRFALEEGGAEATEQLTVAIAKAIAQVGNMVLERQLLSRGRQAGPDVDGSEEEDAKEAVDAVKSYRKARADVTSEPSPDGGPAPFGGFGD